MGFEFYAEYPLSDSTDYETILHELRDGPRQMMVMHIDVYRFAPSVLKRIVSEFAAFRACTDVPLFAIEPHPDDKKWQRFVTILGFEYSSRVECTDGLSRRCFVSKKKNNNDNQQHERKVLAN